MKAQIIIYIFER